MPRNKNKGKKVWSGDSGDKVHVDWRWATWMTAVKNQFFTSACWAICVVDIIEMLYRKQTAEEGEEKKIELSAQDLLDYCPTYDEYCKGYHAGKAFEHIKQHGIAYLEHYPFRGCGDPRPASHTRNFKPEQIFDKLEGFKKLETDELIAKTLADHPVIGYSVLTRNLQDYKAGDIHFPGSYGASYTDPKTGHLRYECTAGHCVIIVGEGVENGTEYWIIKNTWGSQWGDDGYARIAKLTTPKFQGFYPIFKKE